MIIKCNDYGTDIECYLLGEILEQIQCGYLFDNDTKYLNAHTMILVRQLWEHPYALEPRNMPFPECDDYVF